MPALLTTASTLKCPHGGSVTAAPMAIKAKAGAVILTANDTFSIAGCTFSPGGVSQPCISVQWIVTAQKVSHGGGLALTESSVGMCLGPAPQGTVIVVATQQKVAGL